MTRALLHKGQELIDDEAARGSQSRLDAPLERGIALPRDAELNLPKIDTTTFLPQALICLS
jgi:hypothetical protein